MDEYEADVSAEDEMATTARDEIIADWRQRLADAEAPRSADSPRKAWLTRLKVRLYRFLLSLYGDGRWNASDRAMKGSLSAQPVVVSDEAQPFSGKPAKDEGQIRAVLRSVAEASYGRTTAGPLVDGKAREQLRSDASHSYVKRGSFVCTVSLAVLFASVLVLFLVAVLHAAWPALVTTATAQVFVNKVVILSLACSVTSGLLYGTLAD